MAQGSGRAGSKWDAGFSRKTLVRAVSHGAATRSWQNRRHYGKTMYLCGSWRGGGRTEQGTMERWLPRKAFVFGFIRENWRHPELDSGLALLVKYFRRSLLSGVTEVKEQQRL